MPPELETLDQLAAGDLRSEETSKLFLSKGEIEQGVLGLLACGNIVIISPDGNEMPHWRWRIQV